MQSRLSFRARPDREGNEPNLEQVFLELHNRLDDLRQTYSKLHEVISTLVPYAQHTNLGKPPTVAVQEAWCSLEKSRVVINRSYRILRLMQHMIWSEELEEEIADILYEEDGA